LVVDGWAVGQGRHTDDVGGQAQVGPDEFLHPVRQLWIRGWGGDDLTEQGVAVFGPVDDEPVRGDAWFAGQGGSGLPGVEEHAAYLDCLA